MPFSMSTMRSRRRLSSSIFTLKMQEAERFLAADGSDCGIANVNIGTSGARSAVRSAARRGTGGGRGVRLGCVEGLYASRDPNTVNLFQGLAARAGRLLRYRVRCDQKSAG